MSKREPLGSFWRMCEIDESRRLSGHNSNLGCSVLSECTGECLAGQFAMATSLDRIILLWPELSASARRDLLALAEAAATAKAREKRL